MNLAIKIKRLRELRNYTQEHVASCLGISQASYSRWEKGGNELSINKLKRVCACLEVSILDFMTWDEENYPKQNPPRPTDRNSRAMSDKERLTALEEENEFLRTILKQMKENVNGKEINLKDSTKRKGA